MSTMLLFSPSQSLHSKRIWTMATATLPVANASDARRVCFSTYVHSTDMWCVYAHKTQADTDTDTRNRSSASQLRSVRSDLSLSLSLSLVSRRRACATRSPLSTLLLPALPQPHPEKIFNGLVLLPLLEREVAVLRDRSLEQRTWFRVQGLGPKKACATRAAAAEERTGTGRITPRCVHPAVPARLAGKQGAAPPPGNFFFKFIYARTEVLLFLAGDPHVDLLVLLAILLHELGLLILLLTAGRRVTGGSSPRGFPAAAAPSAAARLEDQPRGSCATDPHAAPCVHLPRERTTAPQHRVRANARTFASCMSASPSGISFETGDRCGT